MAVFTFIGCHVKVAPVVVELPVRVTDVFVQVKVPPVLAEIFGTTVFCATVTTDVETQPFNGLVTVNV